MIASLHPCIVKDINILCAGRSLTDSEKRRLKKSRAVIVPQGIRPDVYRECRLLVPHVFPNYDLRFPLEGKVGDALLFAYFQVPHPKTLVFQNRLEFSALYPNPTLLLGVLGEFPWVLKGDRGGEGDFVYLIRSLEELEAKLVLLPAGFILQEWIDHGGRDLRVVVLYDLFLAYWRVQPDPRIFWTNLSRGGTVDPDSDPHLKERGIEAVRDFCHRSGINLAGFDLLFDRRNPLGGPLFLEINYYFGRSGLGGSARFYELFEQAAERWLTAVLKGKKEGRPFHPPWFFPE
jgi:ribosomal protein S6--L-glutamate ligase